MLRTLFILKIKTFVNLNTKSVIYSLF